MLTVPYMTRKGTRVLHPAASALAIVAEIHHDAAEYVVYRDFRVGDVEAPRFDAMDGDRLLVNGCTDERLLDQAHVLNLVTGQRALIPWDAMAHAVKPA